jgi:hypothetical protein
LGLGIIAAVFVELFYESRSLNNQIHDLGLPVLADLVVLPRSVSRPWKAMKKGIPGWKR